MSRINYSEDEDFAGQFELWQANCDRSLHGKKGQAELRVLRDALLALPAKRLLRGELYNNAGEVCAIGAYGKYKGVDLSKYDPEDCDHDRVGIEGGMPKLVAWKVVEMNDQEFYRMTPEERYTRMLDWVEYMIKQEKSK